jgi:hypothetical protein
MSSARFWGEDCWAMHVPPSRESELNRALVAANRLHHEFEGCVEPLDASSGSRSASNSLEALKSAKSTVTCFRSPSSAAFDVRIFLLRVSRLAPRTLHTREPPPSRTVSLERGSRRVAEGAGAGQGSRAIERRPNVGVRQPRRHSRYCVRRAVEGVVVASALRTRAAVREIIEGAGAPHTSDQDRPSTAADRGGQQ